MDCYGNSYCSLFTFKLFLQADCLSNLELEEVKSVLTDEVVAEEPTTEPTTNAVIPEETPPPAKKQRTMTLAAFLGNVKPNTAQRSNEVETPKQKAKKRDRQLPFNKLFGLD